jgi:hypothetical protein
MRIIQMGPAGLESLFGAHHAQEAAEHGETDAPTCDCPPGVCLQGDAEPLVPGVDNFHSFLDAIGEQIVSDLLGDEDEEQEEEVLSSEQKQLDQLGDIVEATVALTGLYAAMVDRERNEF